MAKKYLSIEEAAERLGISTQDLIRHRENGEVRGFADRGTWKFREQDVTEFARSRQAGSDPEIPLIDPPKVRNEEPAAEESAMISSDSALDEDFDDLSTSDSDVRLLFDERLIRRETRMKKRDETIQLIRSLRRLRRTASSNVGPSPN